VGTFFVGREKETRQIIHALERGNNVILTGKYGIGRTSLIRQVAEVARDRWAFVFLDFSQTPGRVCSHLMTSLLPQGKEPRKATGYRHNRFRIANLDFDGQKQPVLVLDDIGKLSFPKVELIRHLAMGKRFRFVAVVENFLLADKLARLRAWLHPALLLKVTCLRGESSRQFFRHYSKKYLFGWTDGEIQELAEMSGGYPLGMKDVVNRNLARSQRIKDGVVLAKSRGPRAEGSRRAT
jgi:hypothetical protein